MPPRPTPLYDLDGPDPRLWEKLHREHGDVAPVEIEPGVPGWLLLTWEATRWVMLDPHQLYSVDPATWRDLNNGTVPDHSALHALYARRCNARSVDGKDHERYREAIVAGLGRLTTSRSRVIRDIDQAADVLISRFARDGYADLISQYAAQLPVMVLSRMFGLSDDEGSRLCQLMQRLWDGGEDAGEAHERVLALLRGAARQRRRHLSADRADMIAALIDHDHTDIETRDQLALLIAAGHDPTAHWIGNTLRLLLTDAHLRSHVTGARTLVTEALSTTLWREPPVSALIGRFALRDHQLGTYHIHSGDVLILGFDAAHQEMLRRSGDLDAVRSGSNNAHLTWGVGAHKCPGRDIAWAMAEHAITQLINRLSNIRLALPPDQLQWRPSPTIRGLTELPVTFTPTEVPIAEGNSLWTRQPSTSTPPTSTTKQRRRSFGRLARWLGWSSPGD